MTSVDCSNPNLESLRRQFQTALAPARDDAAQEIRVGIQSKFTLPADSTRHLLLQFNALFENEYTARDGAWAHSYNALALFRQCVAESVGKREICIDAYAHLTLGYMLGNVFDEPSGFPISISQREEIWSTRTWPDESFALDIQVKPEFALARELALELAVTSEIEKQVTQTIMQLKLPIRQRIQIRARAYEIGDYALNGAQAAQLARQIRRVLKQHYADVNYTRVHVFGALPWGLACWIGRAANAVGPLQLYEFNNAAHLYTPSYEIA